MKKNKALPLVSVIVPIFNAENYIATCVKSIQKQTYSNLEIILINDGSTDNSENLCAELSRRDDRIRYIRQKNLGVSVARNKGIKSSSGDYITFVDADDTISEDAIETLVRIANTADADLVFCSPTITRNNNKSYSLLTRSSAVEELFSGRSLSNSACSKLYRKSLLRNIFFPSGRTNGEELPFIYSSILQAQNIALTKKRIYNYENRPGSATSFVGINESAIECYKDIERSLCVNFPELKKHFYANFSLVLLLTVDRALEYGLSYDSIEDTLSLYDKCYDLASFDHRSKTKILQLYIARNHKWMYKKTYVPCRLIINAIKSIKKPTIGKQYDNRPN